MTGDPNDTGLDGNSFNGLELSQQWTVFALNPTTPIIRGLFVATNPTSAPITQQLGMFNNLGSDSNTRIFSTSDGDTTFSPGTDHWVGSFQEFSGTTSSDIRILTVIQGPGSVTSPANTNSQFVDGDDNPRFNYDLTLQPGETQIVMAFVGLFGIRANATDVGNTVFDSNANVEANGLLDGLTDLQKSQIVNWEFRGEVSVAASPGSVAEDGAGNLEYTFTRDKTAGPLTVNFTLSGDASFNTDYTVTGATMTGNSGVVTFADGDATATVTIDPTADTTVELDETVVLTVDAGTGYVPGTTNTATATITNDDTATVSVGDVSMAEGDSGPTVFTFNVSLDNPAAENVTFDFTTVANTAVAGSDFTAISGSGVIPAGETMTTIDVEVSGDTTVERDEQFFVDVSNLRASGLSVEFAPISITQLGVFDIMGQASGVEVVGDVAYVADLSAGLVVLDISDPANITQLGVFDTPDFAEGVEVVGDVAYVADLSAGLVVLDISDPANITQLGVFDTPDNARSVQVVGHVAYVADEFTGLIVLDISDPANITQLGVFNTPDFANSVQVVGDVAYIADGGTGLVVLNVDVTLSVRATGTITNDDTATVSVGDVTMAEGDSGSTMFTFNVSLDNPADQNVTFDFATVGDTAVAGSDFTAVSGSGVIPAGQTQTTIEIEVSGDTMLESDEQFVVELANPQAGGLAVELASATLTELGTFDTLGSAYSVQLVDDVAYVADLGGGLVVLDVSDPANISRLGAFNTPGLARSVQVVGSVAYVADDSAGLVVLDISDPANITQLGAFNTGGLALSVQVVGNLAYVADGSSGLVVLDISDPAIITQFGAFDTPAFANFVQVVGSVAYVADNGTGLVVLDISDPANITQLGAFNTGGLAQSVQVVGSVAYVADFSTGLVVLDISDPANITRLGGFDTPGSPLGVHVAGDVAYVADGTSGLIVLNVSDPANITELVTFDTPDFVRTTEVVGNVAYVANSSTGLVVLDVNVTRSSSATGTIINDDTATLSIADVTVAEGGGLLFTVSLDNAVQGAFDVNVSFTDGSATGGTDYDNTAVTLNFAGTAGETQQFTVTTTDDTLVEADETFTVNLSATNVLVTASDTAIGTITSDDVPSVSVADVAAVAEGTDVVFTVSLDQAPLADVTVDVITADGTAVAPGDYTALTTQTLTFRPGEALSQTVTVTTIDDSEFEGDETFVLDLSNVSGGVIADAQGIATLTSEDADPDPDPSLTISPDGTTTSSNPITFTFQFSELVTGFDISDITVTNGTARTFTEIDGDTFTLTVVPTSHGAVTVSVAADSVLDSGSQGNAAASATVTSNIDPAAAVPILDAIPRFPDTTQPTVTWQPVDGITTYEVWFTRRFPASSRILQADSIVTSTAFTPPTDLDPGLYRYWVRTIDSTGAAGPWSANNEFEIRPTLQNTDVRTFEQRPTFRWDAISNAPGYEIFIRTVTGDIRLTNITETSYTPTVDLAVGPIRWWIRTSDAISNRGWSDVGLVDVRAKALSANSTSITWTAVTGAGRYILHVQNLDTGAVTIREDLLTGTSYTPATSLASGNYRMWVKAINAQSNLFSSGLWSEYFNFSVAAGSKEGSDESILTSLRAATTETIATSVEGNLRLLQAEEKAPVVSVTKSNSIKTSTAEQEASPTLETDSSVEDELTFLDVVMGETISLGALIES